MNVLFSSFDIKRMRLRNRFIRSATFEAASEPNGEVSPLELEMYRNLAVGEVGLIISGICCVHENGRLFPSQNCLARDEAIPGMAKLAQTVHDQGGKVAVQLMHAGREASRFMPVEGLAPSVVRDDPHFDLDHRAMTDEEILMLVDAFGEAAGRAKEAGFDAVQVHGAHAYLFAQFLSPASNLRQDQWGGDLKNRLRLHCEVLASIRQRVGPEFPVLIKLGVRDGFDEGLSLKEGIEAAQVLADAGYDALEISQGLRGARFQETEFRTRLKRPEDQGYFRRWARAVKERVRVPVIAVGGIRDLDMAEEIVQQGEAALVSMSRPFISEPGLIARWRKGDKKPARCISCNKCLEALRVPRPISCDLDRRNANTG
ncbi:MAG: NADH:flavin oxidoreductase [Deltaproteobacteria bacterium]|nr:NADH:flavin oxidoreductase [Deltaproteobacteria bacterium]